MHRFLKIVELQQAIFREVLDKPEGKAALARLARTCRVLSDTALSVLWERLNSIAYLIRCLSPDVWKTTIYNKVIFQRPMSRSDWETFFSYSSRVRFLHDSGSMESSLLLNNDVVLALSPPPSYGPLLPHLETLDFRWREPNSARAHLLQLLLTDSLVTLRLPCSFLSSPAMLMQLALRCPSLKIFCLYGDDDEFPVLPNTTSRKILSETIMCLNSLQSLECCALDETAIIHLSHLSTLVKLSLALEEDIKLEMIKSGLVSLPQFVALESLTLKIGKLSTLTSLLEVMRFKPRSISLTVKNTPSPDSFRLFFITLVSACDLEQLTDISLSSDFDELPSREQLSLFTFEPLLAFPNVKSFEFDAMCKILFDDKTIETVAKRWPKLMNFSINASSGWGIKSRITHRGLITLLQCPSIRRVTLSVKFAEIDLLPDQIPDSRPGSGFVSSCEQAHFVTSRIKHPATIAAFLSDICPKLSKVGPDDGEGDEMSVDGGDNEDNEGDNDHTTRAQRWKEVHNSLLAFSAVRRQCFNWCAIQKNKDDFCCAGEDKIMSLSQ